MSDPCMAQTQAVDGATHPDEVLVLTGWQDFQLRTRRSQGARVCVVEGLSGQGQGQGQGQGGSDPTPYPCSQILETKMANFYTADLHLNHAAIIRFCSRPFADTKTMDQAILLNLEAHVG